MTSSLVYNEVTTLGEPVNDEGEVFVGPLLAGPELIGPLVGWLLDVVG